MKFGCSYFDNKVTDYFEKDCASMAAAGLEKLVLCFSENDAKYYQAQFARLLKIAREAGLEIWLDPWGVGGIFGGEAFSNIAAWHPEACQEISDGKTKKRVPLLCVNNPVTFDYVCEWVQATREIGAQQIFWDEPHFFQASYYGYSPKWTACTCDYCTKARTGSQLPKNEFKQLSIYNFMKKIIHYASEQQLKNSICLLPDYQHFDNFMRQMSAYFILDDVSCVGVDPYPALFSESLEKVEQIMQIMLDLQRLYGKKINYWLQGFLQKQESMTLLTEEMNLLKAYQFDYVDMWSYKAGRSMSKLNNFDNYLVWQTYLDYLKR